MAAVARRWIHFWFEPTSPENLGIARVLFYAGLLLAYGWVDFSAWGSVSPAFWMPLPAFALLGARPLPQETLGVVELLWRLSLVSSAVGLQTRISTWVAFVLGFYLLGLPHNFGHTFHFDATLVIAMGILACARVGDAWSLDAALGRGRTASSGDYTWPVKAIWVAVSLMFLAAGIAKLRYGGVAWILSSNLSIVLNRAVYHVSDADPITTAGLYLARHEWMSRGLAAFTVFVELGFFTALFSRWARLFFVPAAFAMLIGIRVLMGPTFGGFLIVAVFWIPWTALIDLVTARVRVQRTANAAAPGSDIPTTL
jgi:hypothetical protein